MVVITSTNSSSKAVRKIPAHERAPLRRMGMGKEEMTGLGFRTMARDEVLGFRPDLNEHQLAPRSEGSQRTRSCPTGGKQCGRGPAAWTGSEPEQSHLRATAVVRSHSSGGDLTLDPG